MLYEAHTRLAMKAPNPSIERTVAGKSALRAPLNPDYPLARRTPDGALCWCGHNRRVLMDAIRNPLVNSTG